ncbi:MAG: gliding motility-associated ABC transporter ATP-binding subunit GldA [Bacteroidetes bacterium]|nr:gliding motility-associated ABC transporter ATP-binding subunit GldA [Bacteroidota bacterium]
MSIISKNITKLYGKQKALDDVSFAIQPGEVVGLLGPNGAGKSTMMKIITCFIPPTSGEVTVDGYDVMDNSIEVRKIIGYLPEHNPLYMDMYVKEYLLYIAGIYKLGKIKKERISEIIDITGLGPEQNKKIGALSKGFCQRTGLAQTLLHYPDVLILDEPTSGLDPNQLLEIRNLIKKIGKEKTILLSTHIMQEVEAICDRVIIIHEGRIVADDSTSNLSKISTNQDIITVEFSDKVSGEALSVIPGVIKAKNLKDFIWEISANPKKDIRKDIFQFAVSNQLTVLSMNKEIKSLEEVFRSLTKK